MSNIANTEANATSLDGLVNDNGLITTLRNGPKPSWQYIVDQVYAQLGYAVTGSFVDGFTYTGIRQVGADASGNTWIYTGGEQNLPHVVPAGTVPSAPDYFQVSVNSADNVVLDNGENLQQAIDRLNGEIDSLQEYIDGQQFASVDAVKAYSKLSKLIGQRITTGEYHAGTGYGGAYYDVVDSSTVTPNGTDIIEGVNGASIVLDSELTASRVGAARNVEQDQSELLQFVFERGGDIDGSNEGDYYYVTKQGLESLDNYALQAGEGRVVNFTGKCKILLEPAVDVRHVVAGSNTASGNSVINNLEIDCNDSFSNGLGVANCKNMTVNSPTIRNCKGGSLVEDITVTPLGAGRAITFQYNNENIVINNPKVYNSDFASDIIGSVENQNKNCQVNSLFAENCGCIVETLGVDFQSQVLGIENSKLDLSGVIYNGITFKNCGKSYGYRVNSSWTRQNGSGNSIPFASPAREGTTYAGYDWLLSEYDDSLAEWDESSTYNVGGKVKYTDDGTNSGLICVEGSGGVTITSLRGKNDPSYGTIGAIVRGTGKDVNLVDAVVTVDCKDIYRAGPAPFLNITTRPTATAESIKIKCVNYGVTERVVESDNPIGISYEHSIIDADIDAVVSATGNTSVVGSNLSAATARDGTTRLSIKPLGQGGFFEGTILTASLYSSVSEMVVGSAGQHAFNKIAMPTEISSLNSNSVMRLSRRGTLPASVDVNVSAAGVHFDGVLRAGDGDWITPFRMGSKFLFFDDNAVLRMKNGSAPTSSTDGVVIGSQS